MTWDEIFAVVLDLDPGSTPEARITQINTRIFQIIEALLRERDAQVAKVKPEPKTPEDPESVAPAA
jgi:hypothetical protein